MSLVFVLILNSAFSFFLLINIYSVLEKLIESVFSLIQLSVFINSLWISNFNCFALFPDIVRLVSSANKLTLNLVAEGRSFMYKRNSKGPEVEPCGTPHVTFSMLEGILFTTVQCFLL